MSCSRVKLFIYPTLVKPWEQLAAISGWLELLTLHRLNCLLGNTHEHLRTYVQEPSTRRSIHSMHAAQRTLEGDKPVCTHAVQYVTKWYVSHTDNAQAAAVEAENLNWLSGFSLSKEDFQCWQMDDGEKRNGVEGLESTHTRINTHACTQWPYFERVQNKCRSASRCAARPLCVCTGTLLPVCLFTNTAVCLLTPLLSYTAHEL